MSATARPRLCFRLLTLVALAYVLALNGLLGSIAAGAHVAEARTAAQFGIICTIHGVANSEADGTADPTPGKLACIEHCVLASTNAMPGVPANGAIISQPERQVDAAIVPETGSVRRIGSASVQPPPRGPPSLI